METKFQMDSYIKKLKIDDENELPNTTSTSVVLGIKRGKAKFVMGLLTTNRLSEQDGSMVAQKIIEEAMGVEP